MAAALARVRQAAAAMGASVAEQSVQRGLVAFPAAAHPAAHAQAAAHAAQALAGGGPLANAPTAADNGGVGSSPASPATPTFEALAQVRLPGELLRSVVDGQLVRAEAALAECNPKDARVFAAAACAAVVAQAELARGVAHQARRAERAAKKAVALAVAPTAPAEGSFSATQRGGAPGLADTWAAGTVDGGAGALGATEAQAAAAGAGGDDGGNGDGNTVTAWHHHQRLRAPAQTAAAQRGRLRRRRPARWRRSKRTTRRGPRTRTELRAEARWRRSGGCGCAKCSPPSRWPKGGTA